MLLVVTDFLSADKYTSVDVLVSGTADYFFPVVPYFDEPLGRVKIQTTSKNDWRYYAPKRLISYLLCNCFFFTAESFYSFLIGGKSKADGEA